MGPQRTCILAWDSSSESESSWALCMACRSSLRSSSLSTAAASSFSQHSSNLRSACATCFATNHHHHVQCMVLLF